MIKDEVKEYFNGDDLAAEVFLNKYSLNGKETPDDMHWRLAKEFARIEENYQRNGKEYASNERLPIPDLSEYGKYRDDLSEESIYNLFKDFKYIVPQGSVMATLGTDTIASLSNCFVIESAENSYGGILKTDEEQVQLMKRRGGVGHDLSTLQPANTPVNNAAKSSTGAVSFAHRFSNSTREVAQNGRRGALMLSMDIRHPDSLEFIKSKRDLKKLTGANISVKLNNEFMRAVENNEDYILRFPCTLDSNYFDKEWLLKNLEYNQLFSYDIKGSGYFKKIKAKEYWEEIIKSAHNVAEPGILFEDNLINYSPDGVYDEYRGVTTNPCGEIFMQPYDSCRLMVVNLYSFVENPFTSNAIFNFDKFYEINYEAMRLSDDLVDLEIEHIDRILSKIRNDPEKPETKATEYSLWLKIRETALSSRRTGLGFTSLGDTLASLGLKYDSDEGIDMIEKIMHKKLESELNCTIDLSILRGSFKGWDKELEFPTNKEDITIGSNKFYKFIQPKFPEQYLRMYQYGRRNVSWSTVNGGFIK